MSFQPTEKTVPSATARIGAPSGAKMSSPWCQPLATSPRGAPNVSPNDDGAVDREDVAAGGQPRRHVGRRAHRQARLLGADAGAAGGFFAGPRFCFGFALASCAVVCRGSSLAAMSTFASASAYPTIISVPAGRP